MTQMKRSSDFLWEIGLMMRPRQEKRVVLRKELIQLEKELNQLQRCLLFLEAGYEPISEELHVTVGYARAFVEGTTG